jgi:hypothetical protein
MGTSIMQVGNSIMQFNQNPFHSFGESGLTENLTSQFSVQNVYYNYNNYYYNNNNNNNNNNIEVQFWYN